MIRHKGWVLRYLKMSNNERRREYRRVQDSRSFIHDRQAKLTYLEVNLRPRGAPSYEAWE